MCCVISDLKINLILFNVGYFREKKRIPNTYVMWLLNDETSPTAPDLDLCTDEPPPTHVPNHPQLNFILVSPCESLVGVLNTLSYFKAVLRNNFLQARF
jgi:hypothetical protein